MDAGVLDAGRHTAHGTWRRAAPIACGCVLAGAAVYTAAVDPSTAGAHFPGCLFRATTGLWCPGCGLTRGVHALLRGDVGEALAMNVFTPLAVVLIAGAWWGWLRRAWDRPPSRWVAGRLPVWTSTAGGVALATYGVARNLPWAPFRALAP